MVDVTLPRLLLPSLARWDALDADMGRVLVDGCGRRLGRQVPPSWHYNVAHWRWLEGDFASSARQLRFLSGSGLEGCLALLVEGVDPAIDIFDEVLATIGRNLGKGEGKPVIPGAIGAIHLLALWLRNSAADARKARALLKLWLKRSPAGLLRATVALVPELLLHDADARTLLRHEFDYSEKSWRFDPLGFTLAYLIAAWLDRETALKRVKVAQTCADLAERAQMAWPAAELRAILARLQPGRDGDPSTPERFGREQGVKLLAYRLPLLEPWERALQSLIAIGAPEPADAGAPPERQDTRLAWLVVNRADYNSPLPFSLELREQARTGRGWSKGKRFSPEKLAEWSASGREGLLEQDHLVARHLGPDHYRLRQILKQRAWLALIGHPHLMWAATSQPLDLVRGQLELRVTKLRGDAVQVSLVPEFMDDQEVVL